MRSVAKPTPARLRCRRGRLAIACALCGWCGDRAIWLRYPWAKWDCLLGCWLCGKAAHWRTRPWPPQPRRARSACTTSSGSIAQTRLQAVPQSAATCDAMFLPFRVEDLAEFTRAIPEFGLRGISVTIPHKQTVMKYLYDCEPMAERIGAINTVQVASNGKLRGSNT